MQSRPAGLPAGFTKFTDELLTEMESVEGYLAPNEIRLLALMAAYPTADGEILEIGSFKGKSTIILAKSAALGDDAVVNAVDPMTAPSETDPSLGRGSCAISSDVLIRAREDLESSSAFAVDRRRSYIRRNEARL